MARILSITMGLWIYLVLGLPALVGCGNILVIAQDAEIWLEMRSMVEKIQQKGHNIVLVIPKNNLIMDSSHGLIVKTYLAPVLEPGLNIYMDHTFSQSHVGSLLSAISTESRRMIYTASILSRNCLHLLDDQALIHSLQRSVFDVAVMDPFFPCGPILAEQLHLPSVYFLPKLPCGWDNRAMKCPDMNYADVNDVHSFLQRIKTLLFQSIEYIACQQIEKEYAKLASQFLHKEVKFLELFSRAEILFYRYDSVLETPKPLMPNMVFIGGHSCDQNQKLTKDFENLVNSSGEHGFVVFSLGSMVSEIPMNKAMDIAEALGSIPQTVIWRYTGKVPSNLANNTHLVKWLPQNDLLAHPKVRAFITHAGSHGIYEGICNAVPMVMLPLFGDQMDNAKRIESRGAGVTLNVLDMTPEDLSNALDRVINDPSFKKNIDRLSALHLDRPVHPLDLAVHWVEFVMRHKGAPHLRPAAHDLNWIQYHSLDVFAFLLAVLVTTLFISFKCCTYTCRRCCGRKSRPKSKSKKE
ncbi:UDP-glucuronosyltransferase 1A1-like isoform X10 [Dendropsophus ebraccatus]|uniref:UDP-glucuronosyltransferase 1A1-like isoform X10 n=1 Tax=Dendropsophus ebraccatus TaxID=150705 RepID=UPI0038315232